MLKEFLMPTIRKVVIAKLIGLPILIADSVIKIFPPENILQSALILVSASYLLACTINHAVPDKTKNSKRV